MFPKQNPIIKVKIEKETNCVYVYKSIIIIKNFKNYLLFKSLVDFNSFHFLIFSLK